MKAIVLRDIPTDLGERIEARSRELGLSLEATVLRLLEERLRQRIPNPLGTRRHTDFSKFEGLWSENEAVEFMDALAEQRQIEPEMWD